MKLLLLGKLPPLEGGVSGQTFWMARALAAQGHTVHVVTNSHETEQGFTEVHYGDDPRWFEPGPGPGSLRVHRTTPLAPGSYLPFAQPHVTKLFGLSLSVIAEQGCNLILSWYFEPYGFVAALVGRATGLPFFVRHAGSDLGRLARHPELRGSYDWALRAANALVVTNERELENAFGRVKRPRIRLPRPRLPVVFFAPGEQLDVPELLAASKAWFSRLALPASLRAQVKRINRKPFVPDVFVIGTYGKVGATKGSFDLIEALTRVSRGRARFAFLSLSCGHPETLAEYYGAIARSRALASRTWILPPIAPWRVPSFLRRCNVVCSLERAFPIAFHGPLIAREVLSSGACLVCSAEVARKPVYGGNLVDDRNAVIIADPMDHDRLAKRLHTLVADRERTRSIGLQGQELARFWDDDLEPFDVAIASLANQMERLRTRRAVRASKPGPH